MILEFFILRPAAYLCPPPFNKMPFSFAKIISEPKSILYKDLAEPVPSELFFEITITGLLNWSKILLATIPITPGCQFSELTIITLFLFCLYACSFASFKICLNS